MKVTQLAAQLFTCRDILKTPAEIAATLRRVRAVGYQAVQVSGMAPIAEDELLRILDGEGLGQSSAALFHRFIAYRDGVHAHPFNELVVAELAEVDQ